uniref:Odorant-binding protein 19 n=1 Tax=Propsilocerus akamusi TaxID=903466 RepID=A0A7D0TDR4_9DIPT|nr:odorant-binding protein 19 [Propsilocerus akamusi]
MKLIITLAVLLVVAQAFPSEEETGAESVGDKMKSEHKVFIEECKTEIGIDDESAKRMKHGDFSVDDEKTKCFVRCVFKRAGFMNDAGEPQADAIIGKISGQKSWAKHDNFDETVRKCVQEKGTDECETAFAIYKCYRSQSTELVPPTEIVPAIAEIVPAIAEIVPAIAEIVPAIAEVGPTPA